MIFVCLIIVGKTQY